MLEMSFAPVANFAPMTTYHIGCSGYHYRHWRGVFYPGKLPVPRCF